MINIRLTVHWSGIKLKNNNKRTNKPQNKNKNKNVFIHQLCIEQSQNSTSFFLLLKFIYLLMKIKIRINRDIFMHCQTTSAALSIRLTRKEGNVLFNDALNTFHLRLYGVGHMVKEHSDSERGNPLPPHGLLFSININGSFICIIPQTG